LGVVARQLQPEFLQQQAELGFGLGIETLYKVGCAGLFNWTQAGSIISQS